VNNAYVAPNQAAVAAVNVGTATPSFIQNMFSGLRAAHASTSLSATGAGVTDAQMYNVQINNFNIDLEIEARTEDTPPPPR
jgi:hypothetical protein